MRICVMTMGPETAALKAWRSIDKVVDGKIHVEPGRITDFAAARNDLLVRAEKAGYDWAIMLDTDETLEVSPLLRIPGEVWVDSDSPRFALQDALELAVSDVLMVPHIDGTYSKERIFRLPARGHYVGATHEAFVLDDGVRRSMLEGVTFNEEAKTAEQYHAKVVRDMKLLTVMTEEHPDDPRWWYYLGDTREGLGDLDGAACAFGQCFSLDGWDEESAWAAFRVARIYSDRKDWNAAILWCVQGMTRRADFPELPWLAGWVSYQQGRYQQAIAWSRLALAHSADPHHLLYPETSRVIFTHPPAHYEAPYDVIRWSLRQLGEDPDQAEGFFKVSLTRRQKSGR